MNRLRLDPMKFVAANWPDTRFYFEQQQAIYSVIRNRETVIVAGNKLGKDFTAGFICPFVFIAATTQGLTCRVVSTSVNDRHLDVLWGEIGRFVTTSRTPLLYPDGPLVMLNKEIRLARERNAKNPLNYVKGMVAADDNGMQALAGHHADITLAVMDEASGLSNAAYDKMKGWAQRFLIFGNPEHCNNFFREAVEGGDLLAPPSARGVR